MVCFQTRITGIDDTGKLILVKEKVSEVNFGSYKLPSKVVFFEYLPGD